MAAELGPEIDVLLQTARQQFQRNQRAEALRLTQQALRIAPTSVQALNLRGMLLDAAGRLTEARADFKRALALEPDNPDALTNTAITHARVGEYRQALALYDRSLGLEPKQSHAIYNRSVIRLALGDWIRGFREFESRWEIFPHEARRLTRLAPRWTGQADLTGKTILLHHEQGYGDTLQFSRYVPLVAARAARVILAVPAGLQELMRTLPGSAEIIGEGAPIPAHDYHCPLMSLALAFTTTPETVPAAIPYLRGAPEKVAIWRERFQGFSGPRVGLVWTGRRYPPINHARDMALELLRPLLACNIHFIVLQTELTDAETVLLAEYPNVSCHGEQLANFADTAAVIENLDLVISVDSAVAHLAGALGKPTWIMNRYASCWRWLMGRSDTPWYPSLRLFRQPALGDWTSVVAAVTAEAEEFVKAQTKRVNKKGKAGKKGVSMAREGASPPVLEILQTALTLHGEAQWAAAIVEYRKALEIAPDQPAVLHYLGVALAQLGDFEGAVQTLSRAGAASPADAVVQNHLGNALAGQGRPEEALASYGRSLALDPKFADAHYNLGVALTALDREADAIVSFERAIALKSDYAEAYNNLGNLLSESARRGEALACYEQAIALRPAFIDALVNRSNWLRRLHQYEDALDACAAALQIAPESAPLHSSRGATLAALGSWDLAQTSYLRALELKPALSEASWNLGLLHLTRGDYQAGWPLYEARWQVKSLRLKPKFAQPAWTGSEDIQGKTVLLHAEQGYGDTIQFARYCRLVTARGARTVLSAPPALQKVLQSMPGVAEVVMPDLNVAFDHHCPLLSLPNAFATELKSVPNKVPYLFADSAMRSRWSQRLGARERPRVGLVWSGRATHTNDVHRSIPFAQLAALLESNMEWISLQKDLRVSDAASVAGAVNLRRFGEELSDFADTAALIAELDVVISVDTAVAHLAGALGKPVWLMLPFVADWRWLQERLDSPWYPSARLYRQERAGDWQGVILRVQKHLEQLVGWRSVATARSGTIPSVHTLSAGAGNQSGS